MVSRDRAKYQKELESSSLSYETLSRDEAIDRILDAIDALGTKTEEKINNQWNNANPTLGTGVVSLSEHFLKSYEYYLYQKGEPQKKLNDIARESAEYNRDKAKETINHLKNAKKHLLDAMESQPNTFEKQRQQDDIKSGWENMVLKITQDIDAQSYIAEQAQSVLDRLRLQSTSPIFLFTQEVAKIMLKLLEIPPAKAKDGRGKPLPIVRFLNTLTGDDVSQAQDAIANIYGDKKSGKYFIFNEVKPKKK